MADRYYARLEAWPWPEDESTLPDEVREAVEGYRGGFVDPGVDVIEGDGERRLVIEDDQARYGTQQFIENYDGEWGMCEMLRDAGIAYTVMDEGKYEFPGVEHSWSPEGGERLRSVLAGGEMALSEGEFRAMERKVQKLGWLRRRRSLGRLVRAYFSA